MVYVFDLALLGVAIKVVLKTPKERQLRYVYRLQSFTVNPVLFLFWGSDSSTQLIAKDIVDTGEYSIVLNLSKLNCIIRTKTFYRIQ